MTPTNAFCYEERTLLVPNTSPTVFVVDDDVSVRESLEFLIRDGEPCGSSSRFASSPQQDFYL